MQISKDFTEIPPYKCKVKSIIQFLLKDLKWYEFAHPVHSSDLAASDFHPFP